MLKKSFRVYPILITLSMLAGLFCFSLPVQAFTTSDADIAAQDFIDTYWDPNVNYFYCNSDRQINPSHAHGPENGLYTDYWWEAQLWETVMDLYESTGDAQYAAMIDDVYTGFLAMYPDWEDNAFNDDIGWWALGAVRAYDLLGDSKYVTLAKEMFDFIYDNQWTSDYGGGIWWNRINFLPQKNVATNGTAAVIALRLSRALNDSSYKTKAQNLYDWVTDRLYDEQAGMVYDNVAGAGNGEAVKWEYTYNFGIYAGASYEFYAETGNTVYLNRAHIAADWVIDNMTLDGTLLYEGEDDCPGFKMIYCRFLNEIAEGTNNAQYKAFLTYNASQAFNHRRPSDGIIGPDWTTTPDSSSIQSLAAAAGVSILHLAQADQQTGTVTGNGVYEAENAIRLSLNNEKVYGGYSGRGYVAGWNSTGTGVRFAVNALEAGTYKLTFRYGAAAGNASRTVKVNGAVQTASLTFPSTGSWSVWNEVSLPVTLSAGDNQVFLIQESSNSNWINLDQLRVVPLQSIELEAEDAVLHNLSAESSFSGYKGTGYVAGWDQDGQYVDFSAQVQQAGLYTLTFRYAVGNGDAVRYLYINGAGVVDALTFSGGYNWGEYRTITLEDIPLSAGANTISLIYNSSKGSTNWLNLDQLVLTQQD